MKYLKMHLIRKLYNRINKMKVDNYKASSYFFRFMSYIINLIIIFSIVSIYITIVFNKLETIYLFPIYWLITHNSLHHLLWHRYV